MQDQELELCVMAKAISMKGVEDTKELSSLEDKDLATILTYIKSQKLDSLSQAKTKSQKKKVLIEINQEIEQYIREECWCLLYDVKKK